MSIFGDCPIETTRSGEGGVDLTEYAKRTYVDNRDNLLVLRSGDSLSGALSMGGNKIVNLSDPASAQDAATKHYADSRKPLITVWAEEKDTLDKGEYEWSFGNGGSGVNHARCGYTMLASGRILRMGLATSVFNGAPDGTKVNVVINGEENVAYGVTKPYNRYSGTNIFATPLELALGDRINFRTAGGNPLNMTAVVSLLIELEM